MSLSDLACLDLQECRELPQNTLMAPLPLLRELRCALGATTIKMLVGHNSAVLVSSDLYEAFHVWEDDHTVQEDNDGIDPAQLN
ncbi:hypothetical protein [Planctomicrobium sp. SH527]|uniref:hypothetical protein n=1 Tax=Planctomicrobium sp. SH527 TaxID=3448123 RepID=UPI003F5B054C